MPVARRHVVLSFTLLASFLGCSGGAHAYLVRTWNGDRGCLEAYRAIDVMGGEDAVAGCSVRCLRTRSEPKLLYVSSMCDPNPPSLDALDGTDVDCANAVTAWNAKVYCSSADAGP